MSNDTEYDLMLYSPSREHMERVVEYLQFKADRWEAWENRHRDSNELRERIGATSLGAVVSWRFSIEEIGVGCDGTASVRILWWANENRSNVWIAGDDGELADLVRKFPFLEIGGTYEDEHGRGQVDGHEKC